MTTIDMKKLLPPTAEEVRKMDAYWRAANYLSVGQIYLYDNPLRRKPLKQAHIKLRLFGRSGTTPGLNLVYGFTRIARRLNGPTASGGNRPL
jgi:xylulose-5-phosphate/fructose-6-phosphate phosphoketolase